MMKIYARVALLLAIAAVMSGCLSSSMEKHRLHRYVPEAHTFFYPGKSDSRPGKTDETGNAKACTTEARAKTLHVGDNVLIDLRSSVKSESVSEDIDDRGNVTLPLVGTVKISGLTTAQAEEKIERIYVEREIYTQLSVVVVAQADEYFIGGEVKNPGKYQINGEVTLLNAIYAAGGYTDYANQRNVEILRGNKKFKFNAGRIKAGKDPDPFLEADDKITVNQRWY